MKFARSAVLVGAAVLAMAGSTAAAQATQARPGVCSGGDIASGTYSSFTVTGQCTVPAGAEITVLHSLTVKRGAAFVADAAPSDVSIGGNVLAGRGSYFGLGCTPAHGCETGPTSNDSVGGNIVLDHVYDAAMNGIEVGKNVVSVGGGGGFVFDQGGFVPFSVKDDTIHGNLVVQGLKTTWFGVIRSTIDGNVVLLGIKNDDPDGNEVVHNTIGKNLVCLRNSPAPQFGDAVEDPSLPFDYRFSTVGGRVVGQCGFVLQDS
jgi:hypothetical protein